MYVRESYFFSVSISVSQCHMCEMYIFQESRPLILLKITDFFDNYTSFSQIGEEKDFVPPTLVVIMGKNCRNGYH